MAAPGPDRSARLPRAFLLRGLYDPCVAGVVEPLPLTGEAFGPLARTISATLDHVVVEDSLSDALVVE